jgi:hypothetical protein
VLDESKPSRAPSPFFPVDAVQEFADGNHADRALFVADERLDGWAFLLVEDEQVGVD